MDLGDECVDVRHVLDDLIGMDRVERFIGHAFQREIRINAPDANSFSLRRLRGLGDDLDAVHLACACGARQLARPRAVVAPDIDQLFRLTARALAQERDQVRPIQIRCRRVHPREKRCEHRQAMIEQQVRSHPTMLNDELKALIDDVEVVSFDIFDTLLLRRHYLPIDVFAHAAASRPNRFRFLRVAAERLARLRHRQQQDVTLEQIYATLPLTPGRELLEEKRTLIPNPAARGIYDYAVARGKRVIAVSDMYLPLQFLRERVENAGYTNIERFFVSCEAGVTKWRGDLFRHVAREMGVAPADILHVGDNAHSDITRAREQGLRTWYLPSPRERFESTSSVHPQIVRHLRRRRHPSHSLLLGIMRDGLADPSPEHDYWYRLGFTVAGPVVNAFVDWIHERFQQGGHTGVFLFARDGYLPKQALAIRYPDVPAQYTFASRRLFLVPALEVLNENNLWALRAALPGTPAHEYWTRLGIPNAAAEELLRSRFAAGEKIWSVADRQRLENFFREAHPLVLPDIIRERDLLRDYVSSIGLSGSGQPLIVDIGWRASSQRFLEMAVPELEGTSGAYFGLSDDAYRNGRMSGWFFDGFKHLQARRIATACVEIMELLFSAPHPTMQKLNALPGGTFEAIHESMTPEEEQRTEIVRKLHEGALDFTRALHEHESAGYSLEISRDDVARLIHSIVFEPTIEDIRHLGRLPHPIGLGSSRYETLLPEGPPPSPFALLAQNLGKSPTRLHWPTGLTRAIGLEYGAARELTSRLALAGAKSLLAIRERLTRLLGK